MITGKVLEVTIKSLEKVESQIRKVRVEITSEAKSLEKSGEVSQLLY